MQAETLNCPTCGAATSSASAQCLYCSARLATVACPSCFGMMFLGSRHCPRCGTRAAREEKAATARRECPRCRVEMGSASLGATTLRECARCGGLWVDVASFEQICADREQQAAVLGAAQPEPSNAVNGVDARVRYVPCPECHQLMNRINFARCSGVIVDVCKGHGTWFDPEELTEIVEFIRAGGLEASRAREKRALAEERRLLRQEQLAAAPNGANPFARIGDDDRHGGILAAAVELLKIVRD
ncbi:MAG: zf-TFIIB domain-containing protein [Pyrinomonadaceae bacterium]